MNNKVYLTNSIIQQKEFNTCPILKLGYLHSLEWVDFFKSRNILNFNIFIESNEELFIPTICFDLEDETTFVSADKNIINSLNNFHNKQNVKNKISITNSFNINIEIINYLNGNINKDSVCTNSIGDPFIQTWLYNKEINENICWVDSNISKVYELKFNKIPLKKRLDFLKSNYDINDPNLFFLLFLPSFALENYELFKNNLLYDSLKWPKFKAHLGSYTCFSDPVFHLLANFNNIINIGLQHGGGPLAAVLEVKNEILAYNDFYFLIPFQKKLHNCRGDKSFYTLFKIESTKIKKYFISKRFRIFGFKEMILKSFKRIFYKICQNIYRNLFINKKILPLIIFSEQKQFLSQNLKYFSAIKWNHYMKFHPMDEISCNDYLISNNIIYNRYPYRGRIEDNLWRWNKSFMIVNSYSVTTLIFLLEGLTPFLICLNDMDEKFCFNKLQDEALETFFILKDQNIIINQKILSNLNIDDIYKLSYKAMKYCRKNLSSHSFLKNSNLFN